MCELRLGPDPRDEGATCAVGWMSERLLARLMHLGRGYELPLLSRLARRTARLEDELAFLFEVVSDKALLDAIRPLHEMIARALHNPRGWTLHVEGHECPVSMLGCVGGNAALRPCAVAHVARAAGFEACQGSERVLQLNPWSFGPTPVVARSEMNHRDRLRGAAVENVLVRIARTIEPGTVNGYVIDVGPEFFLLCVVNDQVQFDGFTAMRLDDIEEIWSPAPHRAFVERALVLRGQQRPAAPNVDLSSLAALLTSAAGSFPLLAVHQERSEPDVFHIGRVVVVSERAVTLRAISPDATWYEEGSEAHDLQDITRVDFGGLYEDALAVVNRAT
jgi:hypothetical protein